MFTPVEITDMFWVYAQCNGSADAARREYARRYPNRVTPSAPTFTSIHRRMREGTVFSNTSAANQPARRTSVADEERILALFRRNPSLSTRRASLQLGISHWTVWHVLHQDRQHPYHTLQVQVLLDADKPKRVEFARFVLEQDFRNNFASNILWTDESLFTRDGIFNVHNEHTWSTDNPKVVRQTKAQHRFTVNVWAGIYRNVLIGPHIFDGNLNGEMYRDFLENKLPELLEEVPLQGRRDMVFQHDGAPPHITLPVRQELNRRFGNQWIGRFGHIAWPPRSPDMTPLDFYLWGHMKSIVYAVEIQTREELIMRIRQAAQQIREQLGQMNLVAEVKRRCLSCIEVEGGHFEQLLN